MITIGTTMTGPTMTGPTKTRVPLRAIAAATLLAMVTTGAMAAPNIPSSELPGRARQQFQESPIDRFTQPQRQQQPLWRWDCEPQRPQKGKSRGKRTNRC